uniref:Uncharacterized protein n=1 Tax=Caenorhabditis japonica TaxID=281687 RepID=A0A8R1EQ92_CAEJA
PIVPVIKTPTNVSEPQSKSIAPPQACRITVGSHHRLTICVSCPRSPTADHRIDTRPLHHRLAVYVLSSSAISIGLSRAAIFDRPCRAPISGFWRSRNLLEGPDTPIHRGEDKRRPQRAFVVRFLGRQLRLYYLYACRCHLASELSLFWPHSCPCYSNLMRLFSINKYNYLKR